MAAKRATARNWRCITKMGVEMAKHCRIITKYGGGNGLELKTMTSFKSRVVEYDEFIVGREEYYWQSSMESNIGGCYLITARLEGLPDKEAHCRPQLTGTNRLSLHNTTNFAAKIWRSTSSNCVSR